MRLRLSLLLLSMCKTGGLEFLVKTIFLQSLHILAVVQEHSSLNNLEKNSK